MALALSGMIETQLSFALQFRTFSPVKTQSASIRS